MGAKGSRNILILTTVSGFLCKFEIENVKILQQLGYVVHYATNMKEQHYYFDESELKQLNVRVHQIDVARSPYMLKTNLKAFSQLIEIIKEYDIQAIHSHAPMGGVLARLAGKHLKEREMKIIYTAHGFHFYKGAPLINNTIYYCVERYLAKHTNILIVINNEDYQSAQRFRLKKGGILSKTHGVGLDLERFKPLSDIQRDEQREKLGIGKDEIFALSVGELNDNKNQEIVLKALVKRKQTATDTKKLKYGICGDGFLKDYMQSEVQRLRLEEDVIMFGYREDIPEIVGCTDFFIFPSKREGLGMAALEALAMQIPVLASDNRGTREYMKHTKNGYVCKCNDVESLIVGIDYMMNLTEEQRAVIKGCANVSVARFERELVNLEMKDIYLKLDKMLQ